MNGFGRLVGPSLGILSLVLTAAGATSAAEKRAPNFIVILADDLGAKELSCYGNTNHHTPNLDRLAQTGVQFKTCYSTPLCHPTRFEIMTGQYGHHNKVYNFASRPGGPLASSREEQIVNHYTFAQMLKEAGYATALSGKWQLSGKIPSLVHETGFDEYCMWAYRDNLPEGVSHDGGWEGPSKTSRYWHPSIVKNAEYLPTGPDDYGPDIFNQFVIDFAQRHKAEPFFIYYTSVLTHGPHYATPDMNPDEKAKFTNKQEHFKADVEYLDKLVGQLTAALDEMGLRDDTIIFFTGDNGTGGQGKGQATELGARVPMIVNCPGRVKPLGQRDELVDLSDVMPTLADLAGAKLPSDRPIDGRSFAWLLEGRQGVPREWIYAYLSYERVVRTRRWLLEKSTMSDFGQLFDCGTSRDGSGYRDVTDSTDPEVVAAKKLMAQIVADKPVPTPENDPNAAEKGQKRASRKAEGRKGESRKGKGEGRRAKAEQAS